MTEGHKCAKRAFLIIVTLVLRAEKEDYIKMIA